MYKFILIKFLLCLFKRNSGRTPDLTAKFSSTCEKMAKGDQGVSCLMLRVLHRALFHNVFLVVACVQRQRDTDLERYMSQEYRFTISRRRLAPMPTGLLWAS